MLVEILKYPLSNELVKKSILMAHSRFQVFFNFRRCFEELQEHANRSKYLKLAFQCARCAHSGKIMVHLWGTFYFYNANITHI